MISLFKGMRLAAGVNQPTSSNFGRWGMASLFVRQDQILGVDCFG